MRSCQPQSHACHSPNHRQAEMTAECPFFTISVLSNVCLYWGMQRMKTLGHVSHGPQLSLPCSCHSLYPEATSAMCGQSPKLTPLTWSPRTGYLVLQALLISDPTVLLCESDLSFQNTEATDDLNMQFPSRADCIH